MKYASHITMTMLFVGIFIVSSIAVAQDTNNPYQQPNQYQRPANQLPIQVQQPETQGAPAEPTAPPSDQPTRYQKIPAPVEPPFQTQTPESKPDVSLSTQTTNSTTANQQSTSSSGQYVLYTMISILVLVWFSWWRTLINGKKKPDLPAEDDGLVCKACGGKGSVTKKRKISVSCNHCKKTGLDICHHCGGTGRYSGGFTVPQTQEEVDSMMKCPYCEGTGFSSVALPCCMCKGKKKEEVWESYEGMCPDCKGKGCVAR